MIKGVKWLQENKTKVVLFIFLVGWSMLWIQHSNVGLCYDDYGNASLSYAYVAPNVNGTEYSINDLFGWAKNIYLDWGGRLLYACLFLIPMLKNGITLFMFVQAIVITVLIYIIYRIICDFLEKDSSPYIAFLLFVLFGRIGMQLHAYCTYWASASVLYIWPMVPMLGAMKYYDMVSQKIKNNKKINYTKFFWIEGLAIAFTTLSQEQLGGALIVFFISYIILHHIKDWNRFKKVDVFCVIIAILTYLLLIAAPGNYVRMNSDEWFTSLSLIDKIKVNVPRVYKLWLISDFWIFHRLLVVVNIGTVVLILKKKSINIKDCVIGIMVLCSSFMFLQLQNNSYSDLKMSVIITGFYIVTFIVIVRYFYISRRIEFISYFIAGISSVYCLVLLPVIENRSYVPYLWITFIYIGVIFADILYSFSEIYVFQGIIYVITLYMSINSFKNYNAIVVGYKENKFIVDYNEVKLQEWKNSDKKNKEIVLYAAANPGYRGIWASDNNQYTESIESLMKQYYDIDNEVDLRWIDINSYKENANIITYENGIYSLEGIYPTEWRWASNEAIIKATNVTVDSTSITMHCLVASGSGEADFEITVGNQKHEFKINEEYSNITVQFELEPGNNNIVLRTNGKKVEGDPRELYVKLQSIRWE